MFELNGNPVSLEDIQEKAKEKGYDVDTYINFLKEQGLVEKTTDVASQGVPVASGFQAPGSGAFTSAPSSLDSLQTPSFLGAPGTSTKKIKDTSSEKPKTRMWGGLVPIEVNEAKDKQFNKDGGFFEDLVLSAKQGGTTGLSVEEAYDVYKQGKSISDEQLQGFIDAANAMNKIGETDEQKKFRKAQEREGGGFWGTAVALKENPGFIPQMIVSSFATMLTSLESEEVAIATGAGAGVGSAVPLVGTIAGGLTGLVGAMETALTMTDLIKEELGDKDFNKENVREILNNEKLFNKIRLRAVGRGATIGAIEGVSMGLSRGVGSKLLKTSKLDPIAKSLQISGATTGIETTGAFIGETGGQLVATGQVDLGESLLEAVGEIRGVVNTSDIVMKALKKPKYKINGEPRSKEEIQEIIDNKDLTAEELASIKFDIDNDDVFATEITNKLNDILQESQIDERVSDQADRKKLVELNKQYNKAKADTEKKGIFTVPDAKQNLKNVESEIDNIINKYKDVDRRIKDVRARKKVAENVRTSRRKILMDEITAKVKKTKAYKEADIDTEEVTAEEAVQRFIDQETNNLALDMSLLNEELNNAKTTKQKKEIQNKIEEVESEMNSLEQNAQEAKDAHGFLLEDNATGKMKIIINTNKSISDNGNINVAAHELLHAVLRNTFMTEKGFRAKEAKGVGLQTGQKLLSYLFENQEGKLLIDGGILGRMRSYAEGTDVQGQEILNLLSDAFVKTQYTNKAEGFLKGLGSRISDLLQAYLPERFTGQLEFKNGKQVFDFVSTFKRAIEGDKAAGRIIERVRRKGIKITPEQEVKTEAATTPMSKEASDKVQDIYENQGVGGAMDIINQFAPIVSRIVQKRSEAPNFDRQLLTDEINTGERGIFDLIQKYDPKSNVPLAAYINKFLPARAIEASRRVLGEEFTEDVSERVDIAAEEVAEPTVVTKPKKKKVVLADRLGITEKVSKAVNKIVPNLDVDKLTFKTLKNKIPEITGKLFGIDALKFIPTIVKDGETIKNKKYLANITKEELQSAQMFINKNADLLIEMLPKGATISGRATGVPNTLLKAFYTKTDRAKMAKTGSSAGLPIQVKNKNITPKKFLETFGIIDGKPIRTDRNTSARVLALANLTGKMITNQAVRAELGRIKANDKVINKIAEGKSTTMFSKDVKGFNINGTIDVLLGMHPKVGRKTFKIRTQEDIDLYIEALINDVLPLMPRDFWFGTPNKKGVFGSEFTPSNRAVDNKEIYEDYKSQINALRDLPDEAFGKPIDGVTDYSRPNYKSLFEGKKGIQVDKIKETNERSAKIHEALWSRIFESIQKNPSSAATIGNYFKLVSKQVNHWHRFGAEIVGYSKNPKGDGKKLYEYEHAMPATASYLYLIDAALNGYDFKTIYKPVMDNFKLIALDAADNKKLSTAGLGNKMPDGWNTIDNKWWERYFNDQVDIDPNSIVDLNNKTFKQVFNIPKLKLQISANKTLNKAITSSRFSKPSKGITVLDFDDTLATSESLVKYTTPEGETGTLNAEQFASTYQDLQDQGYTFDFSDFDKVVKGKVAPLFKKALKLQKKFGPENMFVLTARNPQAAKAIFDFLKANGLNIPLKNITGLGNSTAEAKALWIADKVGEGYNDFYFADDALQNVQAVKNMLDQFDVKSKVQQARVQFSKGMSTKFNKILEEVTGIDAKKRFSDIKARKRGADKGKFRFFIPPSHEDFVGLLYNFMGKGEKGNAHRDFFEKALIRPLNRAYRELDTAKQSIANDYKSLNKEFPDIKKKLTKKTPDGDFTFQDAIRVYLWNKHGHNIPGLSKTDQQALVDIVTSDSQMQTYAETLNIISKQEAYVNATENWESGDIRTDLDDATGRVGRAQFFTEFNENAETIFSEENLNKIEAAYGSSVVSALKDILYRTKTGRNRPSGQNAMVNRWLNYLNGSVGSVMFFNIRSAVLQQMSMVNFINFADNNIFAAAKAFSDQEQYWADWAYIFNSDMIKQRRGGIKTDVNGAELAASLRNAKNTPRALIAKLLEIGFLPTQIGDNIAIASGGATFYRNRINTYVKQGFSKKEAQEKAWTDFQAIAESTQQSARPDMVSQQQASPLGKVILAFQNVTSQFNRIGKKAFLDIKNRRITPGNTTQLQSDVSNMSRIAYYFAIQNIIFYSLQTALFTMMFDDDEEDEKFIKKKERLINGSIDSVLRGAGVMGAVIATIKNMAIADHKQRNKDYNADESSVLMEMLNVSPPLGIKARKIVNAEKTLNFNKKIISQMETFDIDNPQWSAVTNRIEAVTNIPLNRLYNKTQNVRQGLNSQNESWQRALMFMGWSQYNLGIENEKIEKIKEKTKKKGKSSGGFLPGSIPKKKKKKKAKFSKVYNFN